MASVVAKPRTNRLPSRPASNSLRQINASIKKGDIASLHTLLRDTELNLNVPYAGVTALQLAVSLNSEEACQLLLAAGANPDISKDSEDHTLLHQAVKRNQIGVTRVLISADADIETSNADGATLLNSAAELGLIEVVKELIEAGCNLNRSNIRERSPLISAAYNGHLEVVKVLVAAKCDLLWKDNEGKNALMNAIQAEQDDIVQFLIITSGYDLNAADQYGRTALYLAAELGQLDSVKGLILAKADINKADTRGCTPFTEAVANQHIDVAEVLLEAGCNINTTKYGTLEAPIHTAIKSASLIYGQRELQLDLVKRLLKADCDVNVADKEGWTPLFHAAYGKETEIVRLLLEKKADVNAVTQTKDTVLHGAVYGNSPEILQLLIKAGCKVNRVNQQNELPLYTAIARRADNQNNRQFLPCYQPLTSTIIRLLLEAGSMTDVCEAKKHQSPIFVAIQQRYVEAVDLLIKAGCDVNLANRDGNTPLWVASTQGCEEIVRILLSHPDIIIDRGIQQVPLHAAAALGFREIARLLLEAGCNVNRLSDSGVSAFYLAAEMNHFPVAQLLVQWGANPSAHHLIKPPSKCCRLYTDDHPHLEIEPLFAAVQNDNFMMVKLILTASPRMPYSVLATLRDILFRTDYAREARLSQRAIIQYAQFFVNVLNRPRFLKEECRGVIREYLGSCPSSKIDGLPLPGPLKEYILLNGCSIMKE